MKKIFILFLFLPTLIMLNSAVCATQTKVIFKNLMTIGTLHVYQHSTGKTTSRFSIISVPIIYESVPDDDYFTLTATTKSNKRTLYVVGELGLGDTNTVLIADSILNLLHFDVGIVKQ